MGTPEDHRLLELVGERVRAARGRLGLTSREAARRAGLSPRFYSDLEGGRANIALSRLGAVSRALETPLPELVAPDPRAREEAPATVALLGLRGAGKSTLGPSLAGELGVSFVELDEAIEDAAGLSVAEVFALHGEPYYRRLTLRCLSDLLSRARPCVVALPGGIVQDQAAFELLRRRCLTAWLKARPEDHFDRVLAQGDRRPMAGRRDAMAELRSLLAAREPFYRQAAITVETSRMTPGEAVRELVRAVVDAGWPRGGAR